MYVRVEMMKIQIYRWVDGWVDIHFVCGEQEKKRKIRRSGRNFLGYTRERKKDEEKKNQK